MKTIIDRFLTTLEDGVAAYRERTDVLAKSAGCSCAQIKETPDFVAEMAAEDAKEDASELAQEEAQASAAETAAQDELEEKGKRPTKQQMEERRQAAKDFWGTTGQDLSVIEAEINATSEKWNSAQCTRVIKRATEEVAKRYAKPEAKTGAPVAAEAPAAEKPAAESPAKEISDEQFRDALIAYASAHGKAEAYRVVGEIAGGKIKVSEIHGDERARVMEAIAVKKEAA